MKLDNLSDWISYLGKVSTDILLMKNPMGTSIGFFSGIFADGVVKLIVGLLGFAKTFSEFGIGVIHWIAGGIVVFNIPNFFNRKKIPPEIESALKFLEEEKEKGHLTKLEAKQWYRQLIDKVIKEVTLEPATDEKLKAVRKVVSEVHEKE